ncbi:MAG: tRNA epoxyqueuosine(34) reductase QueG [Ferruginibacter sp.]
MMNKADLTQYTKKISAELGFDYCGIAKAVKLDDDARRLENWLNKGMQAGMQYMENHFELRIDPTKLVPGAKSVITLLLNYYPEENLETHTPKISKYAWGKDYHEVIRAKLKTFLLLLQQHAGQVDGRGFVDSAPVLERSWAQRAGLGWIGKNGNLLNKKMGSFFFIATLITDLELEYEDTRVNDYCGTCTRCIDACPTAAILPGKVVDGSKCISYYTIELKDMLMPDSLAGKLDDWMFGCDTCQDVCPWNRFSHPHRQEEFSPLPGILNFTTRDWENLGEEKFKEMFRHSPLKRASYKGILRNLKMIPPHE